MNNKSIFASKTFWLNIIGFAAPIILPSIATSHPTVYAGVLGGLNIANRFLTNGSVSISGASN